MHTITIPLKFNNPFRITKLPFGAKWYRDIFEKFSTPWRQALFGLPRLLGFLGLRKIPFVNTGEMYIGKTKVKFNASNTQFSSVYRKELYEPITCALLEYFIDRDKYFLDVGCNWGHFIFHVIETTDVRPNLIYGFEPNIDSANDCRELRHCYRSSFNIYSFALGNIDDQVNLTCPNGIESGLCKVTKEKNGIKINIRKLDNIKFNCLLGLIKIDVEGGEFDVIKGGREIITRDKPIIVFESCFNKNNYWSVYDGLKFIE